MATIQEKQITATFIEKGQEVTASALTDNRDYVARDLTRAKREWPPFEEAFFIASTFLAWSALRRAEKTSLKLDEFLEAATDVDLGVSVDIDPTQAAVEAA